MPGDGAGAVDWPKLTACQADAAAGIYAEAMAGFVRWLAPRHGDLRLHLQSEINTLREQAYQNDQHRRTPNIVANLAVGFHCFLSFAQEVGALDQASVEALRQRCWNALGDAAAAQQEHQADSDPVHRFQELLSATISSGRAHLSDGDGNRPKQATAWGWQRVEIGTGEYKRIDWRPQGAHIGWLEGDNVYLQANANFGVVQRLAQEGGDHLPVTLLTLKKRLKERGLLASAGKHRSGGRVVERLEVRKALQGLRHTVLHVKATSLAYFPSDSEPSEPYEPSPEDSYLARIGDGTQNGSQTGDGAANVSHESEPRAAVAVSEKGGSGSSGSLGSQPGLGDLLSDVANHTQRSAL